MGIMDFDSKNPYSLQILPPPIDWKNPLFTDVLLEARAALAELKGYSFAMPNPLLLLSPAILRESLASSEVENIHTTLVDVLKNQLFPEEERNENDKEVLRYREAIAWGFENLHRVGLSNRLIAGIKQKLLPTHSEEYRRQQNAIANQRTGEVLYTPPPAHRLPELIGNWEHFMNKTDDGIDPLIKTAVAHYQFEAIHPFSDGNGRTGRILMVLSLVEKEILKWPILFISGYIHKNRGIYYSLLRKVTQDKAWEEWILFLLKGFHLQALETRRMLLAIMDLFESAKQKIREHHKKIYSADLVESLFSYPIVTPMKLSREMGVHYTTATRWLEELLDGGFLTEQKSGKYRLFVNKSLLKAMAKET